MTRATILAVVMMAWPVLGMLICEISAARSRAAGRKKASDGLKKLL